MEPLVAEIERRFAELEAQLGDPAVLADQRRYADVAREHKRLSAAAELARQWRERTTQVADAAELASDPDEDIQQRIPALTRPGSDLEWLSGDELRVRELEVA
jgi:peptide chain release factor 1